MDITEQYIRSRDKLLLDAGVKFQSKKVETKGPVKRVHYLEAGNGKPLIMIHGGGSTSCEWFNILQPLSHHYQLFVVDRPGCGLTDQMDYKGVDFKASAVEFMHLFMDAVGLEKAYLLGQSMGGYFSICFALQHPERVEKLLLIGAPAGMNIWIPYLLRALATKGLNRVLTKTVAKPGIKNSKFIHEKLLVAQVEKLPDDYLLLSHYGEILPGSGRRGFLSLLENVLTWNGWRKDLYIGDQLHRLNMPVRFIWGRKDAFESPESGRKKAEAIPDMKFEVVENAGHCPWLDEPEQCAGLILSMLKD